MILSIENLTMKFDALPVLDNISLGVEENTIHGIIGPNGSGKTTMFNVISGLYKPTSGKIMFNNENLVGLPPHEITRRGISRTFQLLRVFPSLTVLENLMLAQTILEGTNILDDILFSWRSRKEARTARDKGMEILRLLGLTKMADNPTDSISIGQRRLLQFGQAIICKPKILLLDECVAGLDPENIEKLAVLLKQQCVEKNMTIIVVEHIMDFVLRVCSRITVLDYGKMIFEGKPEEVVSNPAVIEAYLGKV